MAAFNTTLSGFNAIKPENSTIILRKNQLLPALLYDLLRTRSPSTKEASIRAMLMAEIKTIPNTICEVDQKGNLWAWVKEKKVYDTVFSAHMDTVHRDEGRQRLVLTTEKFGVQLSNLVFAMEEKKDYRYYAVNSKKDMTEWEVSNQVKKAGGDFVLMLPEKNPDNIKKYPVDERGGELICVHALKSKNEEATNANIYGWFFKVQHNVTRLPSVLGADDKLGCYLLIELLRQQVPATYIFHVEEECGGNGSLWIKNNLAHQLKGSKRAIAFDRAFYADVIGSQRGVECCSPTFGRALALQLSAHMPPRAPYKEGAHGTFTDTANYTGIIPECTNISVGYFSQHGTNEHFDSVFFLDMLLPAVKKINWDNLPTVRTPGAASNRYDSNYGYPPSTYKPGREWDSTTRTWKDPVKDTTYDESTLADDPNSGEAEIKAEVEKIISLPGTKVSTNFLDQKYYSDRGWDVPWLITSKTAWEKIPLWSPEFGNFDNKATKIQMQIILGKWIMCQADYGDVTKVMYDIISGRRISEIGVQTLSKEVCTLNSRLNNQTVEITRLTTELDKAKEDVRTALNDLGWTKPADTKDAGATVPLLVGTKEQ